MNEYPIPKFTEVPEEISIPVWVKRGSMMVRREFLSPDDPDHPYNYIKMELGLRPEDYGVRRPNVVKKCPHCGEPL